MYLLFDEISTTRAWITISVLLILKYLKYSKIFFLYKKVVKWTFKSR